MTQKLFVYGSLGPGRPNEQILASIGGTWQPAKVKGRLEPRGWGAAMGFPGLVLDEAGSVIQGFLFTSENLDQHWASLDDFEGEHYQRILTKVHLEDGSSTEAYLYALKA